MLITVDLDDALVAKAQTYTGIQDISELVSEALKTLVAHKAQQKLASMGGSYPNARAAPRRRPDPI